MGLLLLGEHKLRMNKSFSLLGNETKARRKTEVLGIHFALHAPRVERMKGAFFTLAFKNALPDDN